jgi:hypothetical protein
LKCKENQGYELSDFDILNSLLDIRYSLLHRSFFHPATTNAKEGKGATTG